VKGFHVCKPGNAPTAGQVKSLIVSGDRIKSKKVEEGGQNYTIMSVAPRESYKDSYGNLGYDLEIEPAAGSPTPQNAPQRAAIGNGNDDRSNRIERQHSQEMAIRFFTLRGHTGVSTDELRTLIDWFQRDVGRSPEKQEPEGEGVN